MISRDFSEDQSSKEQFTGAVIRAKIILPIRCALAFDNKVPAHRKPSIIRSGGSRMLRLLIKHDEITEKYTLSYCFSRTIDNAIIDISERTCEICEEKTTASIGKLILIETC